jgi:hypothetical protein
MLPLHHGTIGATVISQTVCGNIFLFFALNIDGNALLDLFFEMNAFALGCL